MKNRLQKAKRIFFFIFICFFSLPEDAISQWFIFDYNGPDTLFMDDNCVAELDWGNTTPTVSPAQPGTGQAITFFDIDNISGGYMVGDSVPPGVQVLVTYLALDNMGHDSLFSFTIDFVDTIAPVFDLGTVPGDTTYNCLSDVPPPPALGTVVATDNCPFPGGTSTEVLVTYDGETTPPAICLGGSFTRTWTASDDAGNTTQYVQTITINGDPDPPVITGFPADLTEDCATADYDAWIVAQRADFTATDAGCGNLVYTDDAPATNTSDCIAILVTFTVTDDCGNSATTQATYTVEDNTNPVITPPASTNVTLQCDGPVSPVILIQTWSDSLTVTDDCGNITWTNDYSGLTGGCGGTTGTASVTYTATDECSNASSITIDFDVQDSNAPNIIIGASDTTVVCDGTGNGADLTLWLNNRAGALASDVCTNDVNIVESLQNTSGNPVTQMDIQADIDAQLTSGCGAVVTVRFAFTDECGNTSTTDADFTVSDTTNPVWDTDPSDLTIECDGTPDPGGQIATWLGNNGGGSASEECSSVTYSNDYTGTTMTCSANTGTSLVTFTATDACGNSATRTATVTIQDTTDPTLANIPADVTIECGDAVPGDPGTVTASDACDGDITGSIMYSQTSMATGPCPTVTVFTNTWEVSDGCGNTTTQSQTVTVEDNTIPVFSMVPADVTIECGDAVPGDPGTVTANDVCEGDVTANIMYSQGPLVTTGCVNTGTITNTWEVADACGNTATASQVVTVEDTTPPSITMMAQDTTVECDGSGNVANLTSWLANNGGATASDICNDVSWSISIMGTTTGCNGTVSTATYQFTATDDCGNSASTTADFIITDTEDPLFQITPSDVTVECETPSITYANWLATNGGATAIDACSGTSLTWSNNLVSDVPGCGNTFIRTVDFTVTDECGNAATMTAVYTLIDTQSPTLDPTATDMSSECGSGTEQTELNTWIDNFGGAVAMDGCGMTNWLNFDYTDSNGGSGTMIAFGDSMSYPTITPNDCMWSVDVVFRVEDECGNTSTTTATFSITDVTPPTVSVPGDITVDCAAPAPVSPTLADNCDTMLDVVMTADTMPNNCTHDYVVTRTWTATDDCGNMSSTSRVITVVDITNPSLAGVPADMTFDCSAPAPASPTATDFCDPSVNIVLTEDTIPGSCTYSYTINRTWTATDDCGNSDVQTQVVTVQDITAPTISGVMADITVECDMVPAPDAATATDNCDPAPMVSLNETITPGACDDSYTITWTWTATDECGNSSMATRVITVQDTTDPTFTVPADITVQCENANDLGVTGSPTNVMDNCDTTPDVSSSDVITAGSCPNNYIVTRTWTVEDNCMNSTSMVQVITVEDTTSPVFGNVAADENYTCDTDASAEAAFLTWVGNLGGADATDNCTNTGALRWFAAVPGSYNLSDTLTYPGTPVGSLDAATCPSPIMGVYRTETVDFVVYDLCGNASVTTATFNVTDNTPPVFDSCPVDITLSNDAGLCQADHTLSPPIVTDECSNTVTVINNTISVPVTSANPGDVMTIVDPVTLTFSGLPTAPVSGSDPITVDIDLINVDGEEPTEFFNILGEDGSNLGQTNSTASQCGNSTTSITIPALTFNTWAADGTVVLTLDPNIPAQPASFAVNDICPPGGGGSSVSATLNYNANDPNGLVFQYSVNGGAAITVDPIMPINETFAVGTNIVTYFATDCSGNTASCTFTVTVEDTEPPMITCPADIVVSLGAGDDCNTGLDVTLPLPPTVNDNCGFQTNTLTAPANAGDALLTFSYEPNYLEYIADDKTIVFSGVSANASGSTVTLTITITGDADDAEEYFTIFGEDGTNLGITEVGQPNVSVSPATCPAQSITVVSINIPVSIYNTWAADGSVSFSAVSNLSFAAPPPGGSSDGINPSCTTFPPGTPDGTQDGVSSIVMDLTYNFVTPSYYVEGATTIPLTMMATPAVSPTETFNMGTSTVYYLVTDQSGNADTCSFNVTVEDNIPPDAICQATTIFVNPSGLDTYILNPSEIDAGSTDNCGIDTITLSPNMFTCDQQGNTIPVTMTVTDVNGNSASCVALVKVETEEPMPSYTIGLCGNDTLSLFANPPAATGGIIYTYLWSGPDGFVSTQENPQIPSADVSNSGSYTVTVSGITGCTALGVVEVTINETPDVPILMVNSNELCTNDDIIFTTQTYAGTVVNYHWYAGIFPGGSFIATTSLPTFTIFGPLPPITNTYYVIVEVDGCFSEASFFEEVTVTQSPSASVNDPVINVCAGETVILGTSESGPNYTYEWTGPNGFTSNLQNPPSFVATLADNGVYELVVYDNNCPSNPVTSTVNVTATPAQPALISSGLACEGDDILLTANNPNADVYTWIAPDFSTQVTSSNTLLLSGVTLGDAGNWTVYVTTNGCDSEVSEPVEVMVQSELMVNASNDGPACTAGQVQLAVNEVSGGSYSWSGPNGFASVLQNPLAPAVSGTYSVTVTTASGCSNSATTEVTVETSPVITALSNDGAPCATGADDIHLLSTIFPPNDGSYSFLWTGPNGFSSVDSIPTLPNGTSIDNGSYTLVVTNSSGCSSAPVTTVVNVSDAPATPSIDAPTQICEEDLFTLTTQGYVGTNVTYTWVTPLGTISTTTPSLTVISATPSNSGNYSVSVTVDGCTSNSSGVLTINVSSTPATPVATSNAPVCEGSTIQLSTPFIPGATYEWTGPAGFTSTVYNPAIFNATDDNEGTYSVRVINNGCPSEFSTPINVIVNPTPTPPTVMNNGPICIDNPGTSLILSVSAADAIPGASYTWYSSQLGVQVGGPTTALTTTIVDFTNYGDGVFDFYVIAELNGCPAVASIPTSVVMNTIPANAAFAGDNIQVCDQETVTLDATAPTIGTGQWTQLTGPAANITNPSSASTIVTGLSGGNNYTFLWTLSNGACQDYDSDEVTIIVDGTSEQAEAGLNIEVCNTTTATLNATPSATGADGMWSQSGAQAAEGVMIVDSADPNTQVTGLQADNTYVFTWTLSNAGCADFSDDDVVVSVEESSVMAFAGDDMIVCGDGGLELDAANPSSGTGTWSVDDPEVVIIDANDPNTIVQDLQTGTYTFTWTLDNGACGITTDEVVIDYELAPIANQDEITVNYAGTETFNVKVNDIIEGPFTVIITSEPTNGTVTDLGDGEFEYRAGSSFAGIDEFTYAICSQACPDVCSEAKVILRIGDDASCTAPTIFTPNNDGVNDAFIIPCLATDNFPNNKVSIFNQWGDEVFSASPYNNTWMGTYNGEDLPVGTYYYVIEYNNGQAPVSGFLMLER